MSIENDDYITRRFLSTEGTRFDQTDTLSGTIEFH